jgi:hypothetical protein
MTHASDEEIDSYSLGRLAEPELFRFETHFLICQACRDRITAVDSMRAALRSLGPRTRRTLPLCFCHETEDGLIVSRVRRVGRRKWLARHYGPQLDGGRETQSLPEANAYLLESFEQMFPEHRCTAKCRSLERQCKSMCKDLRQPVDVLDPAALQA